MSSITISWPVMATIVKTSEASLLARPPGDHSRAHPRGLEQVTGGFVRILRRPPGEQDRLAGKRHVHRRKTQFCGVIGIIPGRAVKRTGAKLDG